MVDNYSDDHSIRVNALFKKLKSVLPVGQVYLLIEYDVLKNSIAVSESEAAYNKGLKDGIKLKKTST
jgi:hypothetical protein